MLAVGFWYKFFLTWCGLSVWECTSVCFLYCMNIVLSFCTIILIWWYLPQYGNILKRWRWQTVCMATLCGDFFLSLLEDVWKYSVVNIWNVCDFNFIMCVLLTHELTNLFKWTNAHIVAIMMMFCVLFGNLLFYLIMYRVNVIVYFSGTCIYGLLIQVWCSCDYWYLFICYCFIFILFFKIINWCGVRTKLWCCNFSKNNNFIVPGNLQTI